jgi:hypothetical protein
MVKSTRIDRHPDHQFLDLSCNDKIEKVLIFFTPKYFSTEKGGQIHVLSLGLAHMHTVWNSLRSCVTFYHDVPVRLSTQIQLHYFPIYRISWSPAQTEVIIVGKSLFWSV